LDEDDLAKLSGILGVSVPSETICVAKRCYLNDLILSLECPLVPILHAAALDASVGAEDLRGLLDFPDAQAAADRAKEFAKELKASEELARAKALSSFPASLSKYSPLLGGDLGEDAALVLESILPKFFYFSTYDVLPGECDLHDLARKIEVSVELTAAERTLVALLARAGVDADDFLDEDYDSRKAELQAASADLTRSVFDYWKQNPDLQVVFDTDMVRMNPSPPDSLTHHRILKVEMSDARHGDVQTNFSTRSSGFQWFFSFFAAFSEYQESPDPIIVLLDEPGTSLHGEAQQDFVRFIFDELGASKQTLYTTHSQHMIDPSKYEKLRAVHDRSTRENPDLGVSIGRANLSADRETLLPFESALGYSISQHLFLGGGHHLAVEGSSDFVYLQRMTEFLDSVGKTGLDPRLAMIPVGGHTNMPAFVALLGRRLKVSALIDGANTQSKLQRVRAAAKDNQVPESAIVTCSDVGLGVPGTADIEDLFHVDDYLWLYNRAFGTSLKAKDLAKTGEPIVKRIEAVVGGFDHAEPAHALTANRAEFFKSVKPETVTRFEALFGLLNATLVDAETIQASNADIENADALSENS
jgi:hypothetical protein